MEIKYWAGTDVGRKRTENEDNFLIDKRLRLFVVADGMGGHASGEIASAMAVHGIREIIDRERDIVDTYDDDDPKSHVEVCTLLEYAVHHTCAQIFHKARREPEKRGMGTTLVVLLFIGARGFIAYVGDSRIYLLRGGIVYQLTEDHSLRNELIRMGKITADEFESSPYANLKNAMTRAVGVYESVEVDTLDFDVIPGDSFLLCSDGLYEYLTDDDIANAIGLPEIREVPGMLIDSANTRGGKDNITAVVVQVAGDDHDLDRAAELNFTLDTLKNVPLFRELSYQQLVRVMNLSKQAAITPGQVLFSEGDPGQELFVVLRGRIELTRDGVAVAEVAAGAHLGEMALIDSTTRSASAVALESGKVLSIGRDDFYDVLRREPALAVKLLWSFVRVLAERLRRTTADLADARTTVEAVPDLTELAEEAARSSVTLLRDAILDPDDEADALENRRTLVSGTVAAPSPDAPTRAEPQAPPDEALPSHARPGGDAPRIDPRQTLISTTTADVAPGTADGRGSDRPTRPEVDVPETLTRRPRSGPVGAPAAVPPSPSRPVETGETVVPPSHGRSGAVAAGSGSPPPMPASPSSPILTSARVPPGPGHHSQTGHTVVPPSASRPPSGPKEAGTLPSTPPPIGGRASGPTNLGNTVVPPGGPRPPGAPGPLPNTVAAPRPPLPGGPSSLDATMRPPGGVPAPHPPVDPRRATVPLDAPRLDDGLDDDDQNTAPRVQRRSTLPQMPAVPPPGGTPTPAPTPQAPARHSATMTMAIPPPPDPSPPPKGKRRTKTLPTPTVPARASRSKTPVVDNDAPKARATRRVEAAPQAAPSHEDDPGPSVLPPPPKVPPPPTTRNKSGASPASPNPDDEPSGSQ